VRVWRNRNLPHISFSSYIIQGGWQQPAAFSNSFTYDANGLRSTKTVDGSTTEYLYCGTQLAGMRKGQQIAEFFYRADGKPYAALYSGDGGTTQAIYYYLLNLQGDIVGMTNASGTVIVRYTYDPWGKVTSVTNSSGAAITSATHFANVNPLRYRGYVYDTETQLYYLQSRYYDPDTGRFINVDTYASTGQGILGHNMFAYCKNDPVAYFDSSGLFCLYVVQETDAGGLPKWFTLGYKSEVDAAVAFSSEFYSLCSYTRLEFSAVITIESVCGQTRYFLENKKVGSAHEVITGVSLYDNASAYVHTHPNGRVLSEPDKELANTWKVNAYAATPDHIVHQYLYGDDTTKTTPVAAFRAPELSMLEKTLARPFYDIWYKHIEEQGGYCESCADYNITGWPNG